VPTTTTRLAAPSNWCAKKSASRAPRSPSHCGSRRQRSPARFAKLASSSCGMKTRIRSNSSAPRRSRDSRRNVFATRVANSAEVSAARRVFTAPGRGHFANRPRTFIPLAYAQTKASLPRERGEALKRQCLPPPTREARSSKSNLFPQRHAVENLVDLVGTGVVEDAVLHQEGVLAGVLVVAAEDL